jgi:hypothetical protein
MAISLFAGRTSPSESVLPTYDTARELLSIFQTKFGSTNCRDLTGCDLGTEEGQTHFKTNNGMERCKGYTEEAARIAMSLIEERLGSPNPLSSKA